MRKIKDLSSFRKLLLRYGYDVNGNGDIGDGYAIKINDKKIGRYINCETIYILQGEDYKIGINLLNNYLKSINIELELNINKKEFYTLFKRHSWDDSLDFIMVLKKVNVLIFDGEFYELCNI